MTGLAVAWRRSIRENNPSAIRTRRLMAAAAGHLLMGARQGKSRADVVIELRGPPARDVVTARASVRILARRELSRVRVLMAACAFFRSLAIVHVSFRRFQVRRSMTVRTHASPMRAEQREASRRMIELRYLRPSGRAVTGFTSRRRVARSSSGHAIPELSTMRILVACSAGPILEPIRGGYRLRRRARVTIGARNG